MTTHTGTVPHLGGTSPWGRIDHIEWISPGIASVSTSSHGGYWVSYIDEEQIPPAARSPWLDKPGWYEEDVDAAIVAYVFAPLFAPLAGTTPDALRERAAANLRGSARHNPLYGKVCAALGIKG